jgi:hypothetical protein
LVKFYDNSLKALNSFPKVLIPMPKALVFLS